MTPPDTELLSLDRSNNPMEWLHRNSFTLFSAMTGVLVFGQHIYQPLWYLYTGQPIVIDADSLRYLPAVIGTPLMFWYFVTKARLVPKNFTYLRGNTDHLEFQQGADWVKVPWSQVLERKPVSKIFLNEKALPKDKPGLKLHQHTKNYPVYMITYRDERLEEHVVVFASTPYYNTKIDAYLKNAGQMLVD